MLGRILKNCVRSLYSNDFRWCDVKVPESQELKVNKEAASCKIFVTNITQSMTNEDLREHFETFGTVTDVYIPKPHRKFAFIRYMSNLTLSEIWIY